MVDMVASSSLAKSFVEGLSQHRLMYQHCDACGAAQTLAHYACQKCGAELLRWKESKGVGTVHSVTEVGRAPSDAFKALAPYTLAIVSLEEGFNLMAHAQAGLRIQEKVKATYFDHDGRVLVRFVRV